MAAIDRPATIRRDLEVCAEAVSGDLYRHSDLTQELNRAVSARLFQTCRSMVALDTIHGHRLFNAAGQQIPPDMPKEDCRTGLPGPDLVDECYSGMDELEDDLEEQAFVGLDGAALQLRRSMVPTARRCHALANAADDTLDPEEDA